MARLKGQVARIVPLKAKIKKQAKGQIALPKNQEAEPEIVPLKAQVADNASST
jgi:hypothetical protein